MENSNKKDQPDNSGPFLTPREEPMLNPKEEVLSPTLAESEIITDDSSSNNSVPNSPPLPARDSCNVSPSNKPFISAVGTPVSVSKLSIDASLSLAPSVEWLDAYSEIYTDANDIVTIDEDDTDGDVVLRAMSGQDTSQLTRRHVSRAQSGRSQMSHRRIPSDMSDIDFPKLDLLYGPHLKFLHEEVGETPDENDLFPSTPLDEDQLKHYNAQEELGSVIINQTIDEELAWSDIPWSDPRWLDPRPLVYNAAENAEVHEQKKSTYLIKFLLSVGVCYEYVEEVPVLESCRIHESATISPGK